MTVTKQETDPARMYVAIAKLCKALGVPADASVPDHVLLERLAEKATAHKIERDRAFDSDCGCPGCCAAGDA